MPAARLAFPINPHFMWDPKCPHVAPHGHAAVFKKHNFVLGVTRPICPVMKVCSASCGMAYMPSVHALKTKGICVLTLHKKLNGDMMPNANRY